MKYYQSGNVDTFNALGGYQIQLLPTSDNEETLYNEIYAP